MMPSNVQIIVGYVVGMACGAGWVTLGVVVLFEKIIPPLRRSKQ